MKKILKYTFVCALALSVACSPKSAIKETRSNTPNVESFNDSVLFNTLYANAEMKYDFSKSPSIILVLRKKPVSMILYFLSSDFEPTT